MRTGGSTPARNPGQVLLGHETAVLAVVADDRVRDVSPVEGVARGAQSRKTIPAPFRPLLVSQVPEAPGEVRLDEQVSDARGLAARQKHLRARGPARIVVAVLADQVGQYGIDGESVTGEPDRRRRGLPEREGSETLQGGDPGVRGSRHDAPLETLRDHAGMVLAEVLARRGPGPGSEAAQGGHFAGAGHAHENGRDPGKADVLGLQHAERDAGRDPRVYRVAATLEHRQPGLGRHGMPADHHVTRPPQAWTPRGRMGRFHRHGFLPLIRSRRMQKRRRVPLQSPPLLMRARRRRRDRVPAAGPRISSRVNAIDISPASFPAGPISISPTGRSEPNWWMGVDAAQTPLMLPKRVLRAITDVRRRYSSASSNAARGGAVIGRVGERIPVEAGEPLVRQAAKEPVPLEGLDIAIGRHADPGHSPVRHVAVDPVQVPNESLAPQARQELGHHEIVEPGRIHACFRYIDLDDGDPRRGQGLDGRIAAPGDLGLQIVEEIVRGTAEAKAPGGGRVHRASPVITGKEPGGIRRRRGERTERVQGGGKRIGPVRRPQVLAGLETERAAEGGRPAHRSAGIRADGDAAHPGCRGHRRTTAGASRRSRYRSVPGIDRRTTDLVGTGPAECKLHRPGLAHDDASGLPHAPDESTFGADEIAHVHVRSGGGRHAFHRNQVLHGHRHAREGPEIDPGREHPVACAGTRKSRLPRQVLEGVQGGLQGLDPIQAGRDRLLGRHLAGPKSFGERGQASVSEGVRGNRHRRPPRAARPFRAPVPRAASIDSMEPFHAGAFVGEATTGSYQPSP